MVDAVDSGSSSKNGERMSLAFELASSAQKDRAGGFHRRCSDKQLMLDLGLDDGSDDGDSATLRYGDDESDTDDAGDADDIFRHGTVIEAEGHEPDDEDRQKMQATVMQPIDDHPAPIPRSTSDLLVDSDATFEAHSLALQDSASTFISFLSHLNQSLGSSSTTPAKPISTSPHRCSIHDDYPAIPFPTVAVDSIDRQLHLERLSNAYLSSLYEGHQLRESQTRELIEMERLLSKRDRHHPFVASRVEDVDFTESDVVEKDAHDEEGIEDSVIDTTANDALCALRLLTDELLSALATINEQTSIAASTLSTSSRQLRGLRVQLMSSQEEVQLLQISERYCALDEVARRSKQSGWRTRDMKDATNVIEDLLRSGQRRAAEILVVADSS